MMNSQKLFQLPQLDPSSPPDESLEFTKAELLKRTGLSEEKFKELESYGILPKSNQSRGETYNADDLFVTQIVSRFYSYGIEPRHLRHIKRGADAEALLIDQRLTGLQGKRAIKAVVELAKLSSELKLYFSGEHYTGTAILADKAVSIFRKTQLCFSMIEMELVGVRVEFPGPAPIVLLKETNERVSATNFYR